MILTLNELSTKYYKYLQKDINKAAVFLCERIKDLEVSFAKLADEESEVDGEKKVEILPPTDGDSLKETTEPAAATSS